MFYKVCLTMSVFTKLNEKFANGQCMVRVAYRNPVPVQYRIVTSIPISGPFRPVLNNVTIVYFENENVQFLSSLRYWFVTILLLTLCFKLSPLPVLLEMYSESIDVPQR